MAKVILEYLDIDEKVNGRATKLTFCARIEVSEYQRNAGIVKHLEEQLNRCFFQALVDKGCVDAKDVATYIPKHKPPVVKW